MTHRPTTAFSGKARWATDRIRVPAQVSICATTASNCSSKQLDRGETARLGCVSILQA